MGLTLSITAAKVGHKIIGFDTDLKLISDLLAFKTHIPGIDSKTIEELISKENYFPTSDFSDVQNSEIIILAVPTPLDKFREPDLGSLIRATRLIAEKHNSSALIVNESTSFPGTLRSVIAPIFDELTNIKFKFASAPERVDPGNLNWIIETTPRVIAGLDSIATDQAVKFYSTFCSDILTVSTPEVAEASKIFENTYRQINIALVNEFSQIADSLGFSAHDAITAASTKPFGFMPFYPSIGVGGHCIPVDPSYLSFISKQNGIQAKFIDLANEINLEMPNYVAKKIEQELNGSLKKKNIQIAGIAYKSGTEDLRESPALDFITQLRNLGAIVSWHDPLVKKYSDEESTDLDPLADLGIIVTPHPQIDFSVWHDNGTKVIDLSPNKNNYGWPKFL